MLDITYCNLLLTLYVRSGYAVPDGRTDGETDGIAVASTALAMRALRRAVKSDARLRRHSHNGRHRR